MKTDSSCSSVSKCVNFIAIQPFWRNGAVTHTHSHITFPMKTDLIWCLTRHLSPPHPRVLHTSVPIYLKLSACSRGRFCETVYFPEACFCPFCSSTRRPPPIPTLEKFSLVAECKERGHPYYIYCTYSIVQLCNIVVLCIARIRDAMSAVIESKECRRTLHRGLILWQFLQQQHY